MYFIIISFLAFIFLIFSVTFVVLQNGLYIEDISLTNLKIKQLYIKWNEKLDISTKKLIINSKEDTKSEDIDIKKEITKAIHIIKYSLDLYDFIGSINIQKIEYNNIMGSFKYDDNNNGFIVMNSEEFTLNCKTSFKNNLLNLNILELDDKNRDIKVRGDIILDTLQDNVTSSLFVDIHNQISLNFLTYFDDEKLLYKINSLKKIKSIDYIMKLVQLDSELDYWANKAIGFSNLDIQDAYGWINFDKLGDAYKNIYVKANGEKLKYAYNPKLDKIHTKNTVLEFKEGVLYIYPKKATSYNSKLGKSWLYIDFTKQEEMLTLYLLFDSKLDKNILHILKTYGIDVPFLQNSGKTTTNLKLTVNLRTIDVTAKGLFTTKKANFRFKGFDVDIFNAKIELDNYDVTINKMLASYQNLLKTAVKVKFNAKRNIGHIDFDVKDIDGKKINLKLLTKKLKAKYLISPKQDVLTIEKSIWDLNGYKLDAEKLNILFDLDKLRIKINESNLYLEKLLKLNLSGVVDLKKSKLDMDLKLSNINFDDLKMKEPTTYIKLRYTDKLVLELKDRVRFSYLNRKSYIDKTSLEFQGNIITLNPTVFKLGNIFKTGISAKYNIDKKSALVKTRNLTIDNDSLGSIYNKETIENLRLYILNNSVKINSKALRGSFVVDSKSWELYFDSITAISKNSEILQKYNINKGSLKISRVHNEKIINVESDIDYAYKLLVMNKIDTGRLNVSATYNLQNSKIKAKINKDIDVNIDESIDIYFKNIGINAKEAYRAFSDIKKSSGVSKDPFINIHARNSFFKVYEKKNVIFDTFNLKYKDGDTTAKLLHQNGHINFISKNGQIDFNGNNLNDTFMENFSGVTDFEKGKMKFQIKGTLDQYSGDATIENTIMHSYGAINNILAFVNTIPSLMTFSIPGYSRDGIDVKKMYAKISSKNKIIYVRDMLIDTPELKIYGDGQLDWNNNLIDMDVQLKTNLGSSASKIPLLGYIIFDKDTISTTLKVTGKLDDPKVTTRLASDAAMAPINILKRTITLPYHLFDSDDNNKSKKR
jgi:hypothetical protein